MLNHQLTAAQFQELKAALLSAFPTRDNLKRMVHFGLNTNLDKISNSHHLATDIFNLIEWADTTGKMPQLLTAAHQHYKKHLGEKSAHPQLKRFGQQWWLKPIESDHPDLQRISSSPTQKRLLSERRIDYTHLRDLLAAHNWTEADRETTRKMLEVMGQSENSYLKIEYIDNFPWEDLRIIDCLWWSYSKGHFGFSVQSRIYQELGGENRYNHQIWSAFGDRIGWREKKTMED